MSTIQLSSSITIIPPEPIMEPMATSYQSRWGYQGFFSDTSAGGSAGLDGLKGFAAQAVFNDVIDDFSESDTHWDLN